MYAGVRKCAWKFKKFSLPLSVLDGLPAELAARRIPRGLSYSLHVANIIKPIGYTESGTRIWGYGESYPVFVRIFRQMEE
jgi:hypothetical protein